MVARFSGASSSPFAARRKVSVRELQRATTQPSAPSRRGFTARSASRACDIGWRRAGGAAGRWPFGVGRAGADRQCGAHRPFVGCSTHGRRQRYRVLVHAPRRCSMPRWCRGWLSLADLPRVIGGSARLAPVRAERAHLGIGSVRVVPVRVQGRTGGAQCCPSRRGCRFVRRHPHILVLAVCPRGLAAGRLQPRRGMQPQWRVGGALVGHGHTGRRPCRYADGSALGSEGVCGAASGQCLGGGSAAVGHHACPCGRWRTVHHPGRLRSPSRHLTEGARGWVAVHRVVAAGRAGMGEPAHLCRSRLSTSRHGPSNASTFAHYSTRVTHHLHR